MDYEKIYNQLIIKAKLRNSGDDKHHIIPKSLGGSNDPDNLVLLTHKEHYVAHHLLMKFTKTKEMTYAFHLMTKFRKQRITARVFENIKKDFRELVSKNHTGKVLSAETRKKLSDINKGKKASKETRQKQSIAGKRRTGTKNSMFGKKHTESTKKKMIESRRNTFEKTTNILYLTPWGEYYTLKEAASDCELHINLTSLKRWCYYNNANSIRNQSFMQSEYLQSLGETVVGKTFSEIGFGHKLV